MFYTPLLVGGPCALANRMWESHVPKSEEPACDPIAGFSLAKVT